jgi:threonine dehydrogenase-like Zn-dependent dehydrogenase
LKILQITAPGQCALLDLPIPEPGEGQVLMRVEAVSTCVQWDLHCWHNEPMFVGHKFFYPYTAGRCGHEAVGWIEKLGPGVSGLTPGQRVSAWRDQAADIQGAYAHYYVVPAASAIPVPEDLPAQALAPVEMAMCMSTVFRMLHDMNVLDGKVIGITGLGPAGLIALQMAKAEGAAQVVGFDPLPERRALAAKVGADVCYDPSAEPGAEAAMPEKLRVDSAVDCVGAKATVEFTLDHVKDVVALFGVQREDYTFSVRHYGLRLCGYKGHWRESAEYAVRLVREGKLNLAALISHNLPLERYAEGIALLEARQAVKICYWPWES